MRKKIAETFVSDFTAKDLISLQGHFATDIGEMYRHLNIPFELSQFRDVFIANSENIQNECLDEIKASLEKCNNRMQVELQALLPINNTEMQPKILESKLNFDNLTWEVIPSPTYTIKYVVAPYEEIAIE